jgi:hypothetical protein
MSERFQFTIDVAANVGAVKALTAATSQQTSATQALRSAEQARIALPVPDMVLAQQRRNAVQEILKQTSAERAANQERGRVWEQQARRGSMGQGGDAGGGGFAGNKGLAALEVSRAFEDAQYGIAGVLNNLPNLVMMLGGGAGLAGALSIAAVGATQLYKQLSSLGGALDEDAFKAKMASITGIMDAALESMSAKTQAQFERDLEAAQKTAQAQLSAWQQSLKGLEDGVKRDAAERDAAAASGQVAQGAEAAMINAGASPEEKAQNEATLRARAGDAADAAARTKLEADALAAKQRRQIAEQGLSAAGGVVAAAEGVNGPFGSAAQASRNDIIAGLRNVGIKSDQEQQVSGFEVAQGDAETFGGAARAAEERRDSMSLMNPGRIAAALAAKRLRERASQAEQQAAQFTPGLDEARAGLQAGEVSFGSVDPKNLTPAQKLAFQQGTAALEAQRGREKQAQEQADAARKARAEAQRAVEAAQREEQAVQARREEFEVQRQSRRVNEGQLPDMAPDQYGPLEQRVRERAGLGDEAPLPMASFTPPDLSGTEQAFGAAMDQTSNAVTGTMERLVTASERMSNGVSSQLNALIARISQLETNVSNLGTR